LSSEPSPAAADPREALAERLFLAAVGAFDLYALYLGDRLGLYRALADRGPLTSGELAEAAGIHERYAREWLEHQAASEFLEVVHETDDHLTRRFRLPEGHAEVLLDQDSLWYSAPWGRFLVAAGLPLPKLLTAFRTGDGVPYEEYGADLVEGQSAFTRPLFVNLIGTEWFPSVADIHERLQADPPARVADVACGGGVSSIAIARAYPKVTVEGIDLDGPSIELAERNLAGSGVEDRVRFQCRDAADAELEGRFDLVTIFEALHDMSYPVDVLRALRGLLAPGGSVVVCDERTSETFTAPAEPLERFYYGVSMMHCLPVGMVGEEPAGTGTVMRPHTVRSYAEAAGFGRVEILPIDNDFFRFYRLQPQ
jgi:SAM-dependent methyltransferase